MKKAFILLLFGLCLLSCGAPLKVNSVSYQALRNAREDLAPQVPKDARIVLYYFISTKGKINVFAKNLTDSILTIDRTRSFFINSSGRSVAFYDPNIRTSTTATTTSSSTGGTFGFGLGAAASVLGIGGAAGTLMSGSTIGISSTSGYSETNAYSTTVIDQKEVTIGPGGEMQIASYTEPSVGTGFIERIKQNIKSANSFSFTVSFKVEDGKYDRLKTTIYTIETIREPVQKNGQVNEALRKLLSQRHSGYQWWYYYIGFDSTQDSPVIMLDRKTTEVNGFIYDYK